MNPARLRTLLLLIWSLFATSLGATTTTVSVTSTTTVHVSATGDGECDNFVGACVVYGTHSGAPYTTTVYRWRRPHWPHPPPPPPTPSSTITRTTWIETTTTVSDAGACTSFTGACVVYGSSGAASTVYNPASSPAHDGVGNGNGYIGASQNDGGDALVVCARYVQKTAFAVAGMVFFLVVLL